MNYLFAHHGISFSPNGSTTVPPVDVETHNRQLEAEELARIATQPEKLFLYVTMPADSRPGSSYWSGRGDNVAQTRRARLYALRPSGVDVDSLC